MQFSYSHENVQFFYLTAKRLIANWIICKKANQHLFILWSQENLHENYSWSCLIYLPTLLNSNLTRLDTSKIMVLQKMIYVETNFEMILLFCFGYQVTLALCNPLVNVWVVGTWAWSPSIPQWYTHEGKIVKNLKKGSDILTTSLALFVLTP